MSMNLSKICQTAQSWLFRFVRNSAHFQIINVILETGSRRYCHVLSNIEDIKADDPRAIRGHFKLDERNYGGNGESEAVRNSVDFL